MKESVVYSFLPKERDDGGLLHEGELAYGTEKPFVEVLRAGFPMSEFHCLQELVAVSEEDLGRLVGISPATLHRRKKTGRLDTPESERVVRIARLFGMSMEVFETKEAAREWLKCEHPGLADESPLSYMDTEFGAREVENLLGRIDHGVFS